MREDVLRRYFAAEVPASVLVEDLKGSVARLDDVVEAVAIEDMQVSFAVSRRHVVMLRCLLGQGYQRRVSQYSRLWADRFRSL